MTSIAAEKKTIQSRPDRVLFFLLGYCLILILVYLILNYKVTIHKAIQKPLEEIHVFIPEIMATPPPMRKEKKTIYASQNPDGLIEIVEDPIVIKPKPPKLPEGFFNLPAFPGDVEEFEGEDSLVIPVDNTPKHSYQLDKRARFLSSIGDHFNRYLNYPDAAREEGIEGLVRVGFIVEKDGTVSQVRVVGRRKFGFGLEEAALEAVRKMDQLWEPGEVNGRKVRSYMIQPVRFVLH
jgi:TonB family protein